MNPAEYHPNEAATLEPQLASAADETAYSSGDLDDGLAAGMPNPSDLASGFPARSVRENGRMRRAF